MPVLAAHVDVDAIDTWGVPDAMRLATEQLAADDIKRIARRPTTVAEHRFDWLDDRASMLRLPGIVACAVQRETLDTLCRLAKNWNPVRYVD